MIYQAMLASIQRTLYLDNVMKLVENVETGHRINPFNSNATCTKTTTTPGPDSAAASLGTTPMEPDMINAHKGRAGRRGGRGHRGRGTSGNSQEKCYKCGGYGHHSYDCPTADDYKMGEGIQRRRNEDGVHLYGNSHGGYQGGMRVRGRGGNRGGRRGDHQGSGRGRGGHDGQMYQLEDKGGRIIGEVWEGEEEDGNPKEQEDFH